MKNMNEIITMNTMKNGQLAWIKDYKNKSDVTVEFEDGTVVYHKQYSRFVLGRILNPNKLTVCNTMSTPEALVFLVVKEYFPEAQLHQSFDGWGNTNVDIYIPSIKTAIEVDEYVTHRKNESRFDKKQTLIENCSKIDHVYTISERGCLKRDYKKNTNFDLRYDSHNFRVIKDSYRESYKFNLEFVIDMMLEDMGIYAEVVISDRMLKDVMSKENELLTYSKYFSLWEIEEKAEMQKKLSIA